MTTEELMQMWPREQFEQWQAQGLSSPDWSYEEYLEMRREQAELKRRELERIVCDYGGLPNEQPPELTEEDERFLREAWAELAAKTAAARRSKVA